MVGFASSIPRNMAPGHASGALFTDQCIAALPGRSAVREARPIRPKIWRRQKLPATMQCTVARISVLVSVPKYGLRRLLADGRCCASGAEIFCRVCRARNEHIDAVLGPLPVLDNGVVVSQNIMPS